MRNLRRVALDAAVMPDCVLAADARMSRTDYLDDQAWRLLLGEGDSAALVFQTAYGGRASLVSLTPMWRVDSRPLHQARYFAITPLMTEIAPNYARLEAEIVAGLCLESRFWIMESRAAGGDFTLSNAGETALEIQLDLVCHVIRDGRRRKVNVLTLADYSLALHLGEIGDINPVAVLEGASVEVYGGRISSPKLGCKLRLAPGESKRVRFATAGLRNMRASLSLAHNWMAQRWQPYFDEIDSLAASVPRISTGDARWDRLIDHSTNLLLKSLMRESQALTEPSFVAFRNTNRGWSRRGTGSDHIRGWDGQDPTLAWLLLPAMASIAPHYVKGIVRNYLATASENGFVDRQPGLAGQRQGLLMMPLLSRMAWTIYEADGDKVFLAEVYPALKRFFDHWLAQDADGDGAPEWRSERQMGYIAFPTFGGGRGWSQSAKPLLMETPDLLAYLVSEADALASIAAALDDEPAAAKFAEKRADLLRILDEFWNGSRYVYRDRDTHESAESITLLRHGAGDEVHQIGRALPTAQRLIIRVVGGASQKPPLNLRLTGKDKNGAPLDIVADRDSIDWHQRQGIYITSAPLAYVAAIHFSGLSRVYKVYAATVDTSRLDINHLLPLWTGALPGDRARALIKLALAEDHFACRNGLTMVSRADRDYDASNARGGGGMWLYWLSLIGEGMVKSGFRAEATLLLKRVLSALSDFLERDGHLSQFYHADEIQGFGEAHHIGGAAPLHLFGEVIGIRVLNRSRVQVGGAFTWGKPVSVEQHGVSVRRDAEAIRIKFPSGSALTLPADAPWQTVDDPAPEPETTPTDALPQPPEIAEPATRIEIDVDDADPKPDS